MLAEAYLGRGPDPPIQGFPRLRVRHDGFVAGTWRRERVGRCAGVVLAPLEPLNSRTRAGLEGKARHLLRDLETGTERSRLPSRASEDGFRSR